MKQIKHLALVFIIFIALPFQSFACSAYKLCINGKVYVAKNFDWYADNGYVIKNNRDQEKFAYQTFDGNPVHWTSKYGSITFNQIGKEFPYGGINEQGLVVEQLWLSSTIYPTESEGKTKISELDWIQFQLDNFSTVEEVIEHLDKLIIEPIYSKIHYFVTDKNGHSVIIDFIDGKLLISKNTDNTQVITNSPHQDADTFYSKMKGKIASIKPTSRHTLHRYCMLKSEVDQGIENEDFYHKNLFSPLEKVAENKKHYKTQWTITYNLTDLIIQFKSFEKKEIKTINFSDLSFDKESPIQYIDINTNKTGNITPYFLAYTSEINQGILKESIDYMKLKFQFEQLNKHQMNPSKTLQDTLFINSYSDLEVVFNIKQAKGRIKFYISNSEENFKRRIPAGGGDFKVTNYNQRQMVYSLPKAEYAIGSFHDVNGNGKLDFNWIHFPKEPFAFSNNANGFLWMTPNFKKAKFSFNKNKKVEINIK